MPASKQPAVPADVARQANRAIFYRYLAILSVLALAAIGWIGLHDVQQNQDPCSENLHSLQCQARTCVRLNDVHAKLTPYCAVLLDKVRKGQQPLGPGAKSSPADVGRHDLVTGGSSGGGSSGSGIQTGGAGSGGASPGSSPPSAATAPVDIHTPSIPGIGQLPVPPVCTGLINLNC